MVNLGNSGSSAGAHLHFEIRDSKTQKPINPLYFNFKIKDEIKPNIKKLKIYNLNNTNKHQNFDVVKKIKIIILLMTHYIQTEILE